MARFQAGQLTDDVHADWLTVQLLAITLATGVLDAVSYGEYQVFASNQTGNVIVLLSLAIGIRTRYAGGPALVTTAVSLSTFLACSFTSGRIGMRSGVLAIAAVLMYRGTWYALASSRGHGWDALPVSLLALVGGLQVSQARQSGIQEIPTAMLTSPMVEFLNHPHLFAPCFRLSLSSPSRPRPSPAEAAAIKSRNLRALYLFTFVTGVTTGAALHRSTGPASATFFGLAIRLVSFVAFVFVPAQRAPLSASQSLPCPPSTSSSSSASSSSPPCSSSAPVPVSA
ncbi:uncharacterized protein PFL1_01130 [Pseudozyma flocculosa PF-1]|uniref:uncharacterized protein n=1 Tax=Pseudozyma flocculosa PF-1 TaxID=1277687 RepID=UPI00045606C5|nr:uncharacterized protein PFL1_01130 [Pseudozyma flocculosa PF-1]EPQ31798.1 hypothetical protein PFL1_01130 [Pseudozyma flocculosa PF-1]